MSDVICPRCGSDALVGLAAELTNTYRCEKCAAMVRYIVETKHAARPPHPLTQIGRRNP